MRHRAVAAALNNLYWLPVLFPILVSTWFVASYSVDIPFWDEFLLPLRMIAVEAKHTTLIQAAWQQQNEHRLFFPFLIIYGLAKITYWNVIAESWLMMSIAALGFVLLASLLWRMLPDGDRTCALINTSALYFSLSQWENWLWGLQIQLFLTVLCFIGVLYLLAREYPQPRHIAPVFLLAGVSSFSFASGLLVWPIVVVMLVFHPRLKQRAICTVAAGGLGLLSVAVYFYGYATPPGHPNPIDTIAASPTAYVLYVLRVLGNPVSFGAEPALSGALGIAFFCWASWLTFSRKLLAPLSLLVLIAGGSFAILSAPLIALGRAESLPVQALSSRYVTLANYIWISNIAYMYVLTSNYTTPAFRRVVRPALCGLLLLVFAPGYVSGWAKGEHRYHKLTAIVSEIRSGYPAVSFSTLNALYQDPDGTYQALRYMHDNGLSLFRNSKKQTRED